MISQHFTYNICVFISSFLNEFIYILLYWALNYLVINYFHFIFKCHLQSLTLLFLHRLIFLLEENESIHCVGSVICEDKIQAPS